jgi:hypothetical protein
MQDLWLLLLGWLLGLLGGPIVEAIKRRRDRIELAKAIRVELEDVRGHAAAVANLIWGKHGSRTRQRMQWAVDHLQHTQHPGYVRARDTLRGVLASATDEQLEVAVQRSVPPNTTSSPRLLEMPYLHVNLHRLSMLDDSTQQTVHALLTNVRFHNEFVEESRVLRARTFEASLSAENHQVIVDELRQLEELLVQLCEVIADGAASAIARLPRRRILL